MELGQGRIKIEKELAKIKEEEEEERKGEAEEIKKEEEAKKEHEENMKKQEEEIKQKAENKKKQEEDVKRLEENIQKGNNVVERKDEDRGKSETAKKAKEKMKKWLEDELETLKEAIRVKKEIAIVRGAVEANRIAEGENLYGDEVEPGIEKLINVGLTPTSTDTLSPKVQPLHRPQKSSPGLR
jgi:hypothetical protein